MDTPADYKFMGWMGLDKTAGEGKMVWQEFTPKAWEETDVDIQVTHSGICGSDLHVLRSGWVCLPCTREVLRLKKTCRGRRRTPVAWVTRSWAELCA